MADIIAMMPSILSKNSVVSGELDWYCLACRALFSTEQHALDHVRESKHARNVSASAYLPELRRHFIRKVSGVYLCEACGVPLGTVARARMHVALASHAARRSACMLRRDGDTLLFHDDIEIAPRAWQGLVDDTCVLCDAEFDHEYAHIAEQKHILNLISRKVTVTDKDDIYRQVQDHYQCLTCNKILSADTLNEHLESAQHRSSLTKRSSHLQHDTNTLNEAERSEEPTTLKGAAYAKDTSNDKQRTTSVTDTGSKRTAGTTLYTRPVLVNKKEELSGPTSVSEPAQSFGAKNGESATASNKMSRAKSSTEKPVTPHKRRQHEATRHNEQTSNTFKKTLLKECVSVTDLIEIRHHDRNDEKEACLVFNNSFVINIHTFMGIVLFHNKIICQICHIDLTQQNLHKHIQSSQHQDVICNCYFITSLENEFVRQLKTDLFDCTYCGHVEHDWYDMLEHLDTQEHKRYKEEHQRLLIEYRMSMFEHQVMNSLPYNIAAMLQRMRMF